MKISNRVLAIPTFIIISTVSSFLPIQAQDSAKQESAAVMAKEIADLRDQLSKLQTTINERHKKHITSTTKTNADPASTGGMSMGKGMEGMKMGKAGMEMGMSMMKKGMGKMDMETMSLPSDASVRDMHGMNKGIIGTGWRMMSKMPNSDMNASELHGSQAELHHNHVGLAG